MANQLNLGGQNLQDYRLMFALTDDDLQQSILDYASGVTTFNCEMLAEPGQVVSCDALYDLSVDELRQVAEQRYQAAYVEMQVQADKMLWQAYSSLDELAVQRRQQIDIFLQDFTQGKAEKRYLAQTEEALPFEDATFDLALSHYYFFHDNHHRAQARYIQEIKALCRVAAEVRIFPLLDRFGEISAVVGPVMLELQQLGYGIEIKQVDFNLHKNGNALLRIWMQECQL